MTVANQIARNLNVRYLRPHLSELQRQRLKLLWFAWGYFGLLRIQTLSRKERLSLLGRFLRIDWNIPHAHYPAEILHIVRSNSDSDFC